MASPNGKNGTSARFRSWVTSSSVAKARISIGTWAYIFNQADPTNDFHVIWAESNSGSPIPFYKFTYGSAFGSAGSSCAIASAKENIGRIYAFDLIGAAVVASGSAGRRGGPRVHEPGGPRTVRARRA